VVGSLWAVNDFATALLMGRFHDNVYKGKKRMTKAAALRDAQRWLRDLSAFEVEEIRALSMERLAAARAATQAPSPSGIRGLSVGLPPGGAASRAGDRPLSNPCYWAAFQCIGAGWPVATPDRTQQVPEGPDRHPATPV
jgi:CHAT domain-containing protein